MQPCRTPFEIGNASERTPSTLTLPSIPLCSDCRIRVNLSVQPNLLNTVQRPSLFTVSKAFERSTKTVYRSLFCSVHFFTIIIQYTIYSTIYYILNTIYYIQ